LSIGYHLLAPPTPATYFCAAKISLLAFNNARRGRFASMILMSLLVEDPAMGTVPKRAA
jgi:hypothetical protein